MKDILITLILVLLSAQTFFSSDSYNGFDISKSLIQTDEILPGDPPRDGIQG
jgi:hypothetical protein